MSPYGLARELKISVGEASDYIDKFFTTFPNVRVYQEKTAEGARKKGFVMTLMGRKRYVANIDSHNRTIREFAERAAINAPIQGTAADIIKKAMIDIMDRFEKEKLKTKMILQVHDELVFSTIASEKEKVIEIVKDLMENAVKINVPLEVTIGEGKNWYECG